MIAVSTPERAGALAERLAAEPLAEQAGAVLRAARIMEAVREVVAAGRAESGRVDAEALLWAAWHASGRAQAWRDRALERAGHADSLLAEAAEHDLDVVTPLLTPKLSSHGLRYLYCHRSCGRHYASPLMYGIAHQMRCSTNTKLTCWTSGGGAPIMACT